MLIQSWRAMKLLEYIPQIDSGTLSACWYAGNEKPHPSDEHFIDELAAQSEDPARFHAMRAEILASVPHGDELDAMLTIVRDRGIDVSVRELQSMVDEGKISSHPIISELVAKQEAESADYKTQEQFIAAPMLPKESLGVLFAELGITNMLDGVPFGGYGMDWGHIKLTELDAYVKRYSTGKYCSGAEFALRRTTTVPKTRSASIARGVTMVSTSVGEIEEPFVIAKDGTKYTFTSAAYRDGGIMVSVNIEKKGIEPKTGTYPVSDLRSTIGPLSRFRRRLRRRV